MYVGKSKQLHSDIESNIDKLFEPRLEQAENWFNYGMGKEQLARAVLDAVIPHEDQQAINKLGDKYFHKYTELHVYIGNDTYTFDVGSVYIPPKLTQRYNTPNKITEGPVFDIFTRRQAAIDAIRNERMSFKTAFNKAWEAVPSVNALLKVWPAAEHLISSIVIQRINTKGKRYDKAQIAEEIDVGNLSTQLLKAKMQS
jgi:hypothetical protein